MSGGQPRRLSDVSPTFPLPRDVSMYAHVPSESSSLHSLDPEGTSLLGRQVSEPRFDERTLTFAPMPLNEVLAAPQNELEAFLTQIYKSVAQSASLNEKVRVAAHAYLQTRRDGWDGCVDGDLQAGNGDENMSE